MDPDTLIKLHQVCPAGYYDLSAKQRYHAKHARIPGLRLITWHSHFCVDLLAVAHHPAGKRTRRYAEKWGSSIANALVQTPLY